MVRSPLCVDGYMDQITNKRFGMIQVKKGYECNPYVETLTCELKFCPLHINEKEVIRKKVVLFCLAMHM